MSKIIYSEDHRLLVGKLKKARLDSGLNQNEVAELLKKTQSYISKLESGQRKIGIIDLKKIAEIYKKNVAHFIK